MIARLLIIWGSTFFAAGAVVVVLLYPFGRRLQPWMPLRWTHEGGDLFAKKESLLRAIKDVEFEYQNGTLAKEDRDVLVAGYRKRAVAVMKLLEEKGGEEERGLREAIESEVAAERKTLEA